MRSPLMGSNDADEDRYNLEGELGRKLRLNVRLC